MSTLSDLTLSYETLADDPIEMGIHYGKSVLNVLSGKLTQLAEPVRAVAPVALARSETSIQSRMITRPRPALQRRDFTEQAIRPRPIFTTSRPLQNRALIGAL
jgi:hypothetical protein